MKPRTGLYASLLALALLTMAAWLGTAQTGPSEEESHHHGSTTDAHHHGNTTASPTSSASYTTATASHGHHRATSTAVVGHHHHHPPQCVLYADGADSDLRWVRTPNLEDPGAYTTRLVRDLPWTGDSAFVEIRADPSLADGAVPVGGSQWRANFRLMGEWKPTVPGASFALDDRLEVRADLVLGGNLVAQASQDVSLADVTATSLTATQVDAWLRFEFAPAGPAGSPTFDDIKVVLWFALRGADAPVGQGTPGTLELRIPLGIDAALIVPADCPTEDGGGGPTETVTATPSSTLPHHHAPEASNASPLSWGPAVVTATMGIAGVSYFRPGDKP